MKRCRIKITVTRVYEAEFEDTRAAGVMFRTLEQDPNPATIVSMSQGGWSVRATDELKRSVEPLGPLEVP